MLAPRHGSITPPSPQPNKQTPVSDATDILSQAPFIENTLVDRTALNIDTFREEYKALIGFSDGIRVTVTYFQRNVNLDDRRSDAVDIDFVANIINVNRTCIENLELTLKKDFEIAYAQDTTETTITGMAAVYQGMNPNIGDAFIYTMTDGKSILFRVDSVEPLSIRQDRNHQITFSNYKFVTTEDVQLLITSSTAILKFDKETFFSSTSTLLYADSYTQLQTLRQMRNILARYYFDTFYHAKSSALLTPTEEYDPYLTRFITSKISFSEVNARPTQLLIDPTIYNFTIWARMLETYNLSVTDLFSTFHIHRNIKTYTSVAINGLLNYPVVTVEKGSRIPNVKAAPERFSKINYVFSANFYSGEISQMTGIEALVYKAMTTRKATSNDIKTFIVDYLNAYTTLPPDQQFYQLAVYFFLIDTYISCVSKQTTNKL